jgi:hypothetical protein
MTDVTISQLGSPSLYPCKVWASARSVTQFSWSLAVCFPCIKNKINLCWLSTFVDFQMFTTLHLVWRTAIQAKIFIWRQTCQHLLILSISLKINRFKEPSCYFTRTWWISMLLTLLLNNPLKLIIESTSPWHPAEANQLPYVYTMSQVKVNWTLYICLRREVMFSSAFVCACVCLSAR